MNKEFQERKKGKVKGRKGRAEKGNKKRKSLENKILAQDFSNSKGQDRKSTRLNSSHSGQSRMPSSA